MKKELSTKFKSKLIEINITGVTGYVWSKDLLLDFINDEESTRFAILGGDVIEIGSDGKMKYTYDNWGIDGRNIGESFHDYCKRCAALTREYIENYPTKENIRFIVVMTCEVTAGM
jgi:hypothetical protein